MGTADRVRAAIERPTNEASKLLAELQHASDAERLTVIVDSWCRGLAAAIEELAVGLDELERQRDEEPPSAAGTTRARLGAPKKQPEDEASRKRAGGIDADEDELLAKAQQSRAATEELREASSTDEQ